MRKLITILAMLAMASFGLVACGSETDASENWRPINLTLEGAAEGVKCEQVDSAIRQVNRAVEEQDEELLQELGLLKDDKIDDGVVKTVRERLNATKSNCDSVAVEATSEDCPDGSPLTYDPNKDFNVVSDEDGDGVAVNNREEDLAAIKADPRNLAYRAHDLGFWENPNDWDALATNEGKCLSREGESLFAKVEGALTASSTKVNENGKADPNWYNTGMNAGGPVVNPVAGIEGNLDAIVYTLADGTVIVVLKRCGNLALPAAPKHYAKVHVPGSRTPPPPGTGGPPPTTPPTVPPTTVAPKNPGKDPYPRGNAPQGGGPNATPGPGVQQPYTPPPAAPYTPPAPPAYTPPPAPPTVTQQPAPQQPTTVAPSTQPPNHGTVVPTPGGDFG